MVKIYILSWKFCFCISIWYSVF